MISCFVIDELAVAHLTPFITDILPLVAGEAELTADNQDVCADALNRDDLLDFLDTLPPFSEHGMFTFFLVLLVRLRTGIRYTRPPARCIAPDVPTAITGFNNSKLCPPRDPRTFDAIPIDRLQLAFATSGPSATAS